MDETDSNEPNFHMPYDVYPVSFPYNGMLLISLYCLNSLLCADVPLRNCSLMQLFFLLFIVCQLLSLFLCLTLFRNKILITVYVIINI